MEKDKKSDPEEMQRTINRLREEGRLPSEEEFVRAVLEVRRKFKKKETDGRRSHLRTQVTFSAK